MIILLLLAAALLALFGLALHSGHVFDEDLEAMSDTDLLDHSHWEAQDGHIDNPYSRELARRGV